jgi:Ca-activated chloride channel family protein
MKRKSLRSLFLAVLLITAFASSKSSQTKPQNKKPATKPAAADEIDAGDVIRINTTVVNSRVLVLGRNGKFVPSLTRDQFQILENGVPQEIAYFAPVAKPITIAILIDSSGSSSLAIQDIQDVAISLIDKMRAADRALVISFSGQIKTLLEATADHELLKQAVRSIRLEGNSRVYDALSFVVTEKLNRGVDRTAVVLFSDGVDNDSREATFESSLEKIASTQTLVFPIQFNTFKNVSRNAPEGSGFNEKDYVRADSYLHEVAALCGGGVYPAESISDLDTAVAKIADELHNEYSVGYYPRNPVQPNEQRRVEVRTKLPQLVVRSRTSYELTPSGTVIRLAGQSTAASEIGARPLVRDSNESKQAVDARWICKGTDAPTDFVVVKEGFDSKCPKSTRQNDETNAWFMKRPEGNEIMCKGFMKWRGRELAGAPVPTGYVVTSATTSLSCAKSNDPVDTTNAWIIRKPSGSDNVCKGFPLPRGFVMVSEVVVPGCPEKPGGPNGWRIRPR